MSNDKNKRISSQVMELKDLISGPLVATIDADYLSAQRYLDYLFKITFESYDAVTGKVGAMRMLTFNYNSHDLIGSRVQTVSIPLLTLVPLPLLQVQEADFDFDIQVLDASSKQQKETFSFKTGQTQKSSNNLSVSDTRLRVALASSSGGQSSKTESRQSSLNANMKVHVKMRQADMPGGLSTLLNKAVNNMVTDISYDTDERLEDCSDERNNDTESRTNGTYSDDE